MVDFIPLVSDPDYYPMKFLYQFLFSLQSIGHLLLSVSLVYCENGKKKNVNVTSFQTPILNNSYSPINVQVN